MRSTVASFGLVLLACLLLAVAVVADTHYSPTDSCNVECSSNSDCYGYVCSRCALPDQGGNSGSASASSMEAASSNDVSMEDGSMEDSGVSMGGVSMGGVSMPEGGSSMAGASMGGVSMPQGGSSMAGASMGGASMGGVSMNSQSAEEEADASDNEASSMPEKTSGSGKNNKLTSDGNEGGKGNNGNNGNNGNGSNKKGTCVRGFKCGELCGQDLDCDQLSTCSSCINSVCSATDPPCGTVCYTDNDCGNEKCSKCEWPGVCVPAAACSASCASDSDCNRLGLCGSCIDRKCAATCGKTCQTDSQCEKSCPHCSEGTCRAAVATPSPTPTPTPAPAPPPASTPTPTPAPPTPCDNDYIEVTVRVPKSAACKQCKNGGCRA